MMVTCSANRSVYYAHSCHILGYLFGGKKFGTSHGSRPFHTVIGENNIIKGLDEGIPRMSVSERATMICTADFVSCCYFFRERVTLMAQAYGALGLPGLIPLNSILKFDIGLIKIN
ncbi:FKBP-like protein [Calocera cornea HHB12733]|uniref:peptidylprolyl isomerase n=1 Tax=Calocera cornea HHB12733 TaxID=1353952 RepID=A0A165IC73_9BASI|nr:FKBP-like protein [Calocera cornea HHB12733]